MDRIKQLCAFLEKCESFADVACDHGYVAQYMLRNGLCKRAVVSDISDKCLSKARNLLPDFINAGTCRAVCCDGLEKIEKDTDFVFIAGIGGEEIIRILKNGFIPEKFLFQPMKNSDKLRLFLLQNGCFLEKDDFITVGAKYYFVIKGKRGAFQSYTSAELAYGKDSLHNPKFHAYLKSELAKKRSYLSSNLSAENRLEIERQIWRMEEVLESEIN